MVDIKAGIVCVTKFCTADSKKFKSYINYIARSEAAKSKNVEKFNIFGDYLDYVHDTKKSSMLFSRDSTCLSTGEKYALKKRFEKAQKKGSLMWQTVISFDNRYLNMLGILSNEGILDEKRLMIASQKAINKMLAREALEHGLWTAAIHYNTDNIHIHVATVEEELLREKGRYRLAMRDENGKAVKILNKEAGKEETVYHTDMKGRYIYTLQTKGRFREGSMHGKDGLRSVLRAELEGNKEVSVSITSLIRTMQRSSKEDIAFARAFGIDFKILHETLKNDGISMKDWNYNNHNMTPYTPIIDNMIDEYLEKYQKGNMAELNKLLDLRLEDFGVAYGENHSNYKENILKKELYPRLGNAILKEMRAYEKALRYERRNSWKGKKGQSQGKRKNREEEAEYHLQKGLYHLMRSLNNSYDEYLAERNYKELEWELEM